MSLPKITLLHQDLDTLLNAWAHTPATPAQHRRWPPERALFHRQLGQDQPDTLRLLAEDGGDGEPVFSVKARTVAAYFSNSLAEHRWPSERDLVRLGRFTHLESERILALVLKMQWERYYLEAKPPSSGSLLDVLPQVGAADQRLVLEFQPGAGRSLDSPALFALFEQQGNLASGAGYHQESFRVLIHRLIQVHGQLHAIDSPELLAFVAQCRTERQLLAAASDSEQERFWRTKLMWISADQELGNQLLELENQRLRNANLHQRWLATFGNDYQTLRAAQLRLQSLRRRVQYKAADPSLSAADLDRLELEYDSAAQAELERLQADIAMAHLLAVVDSFGSPADGETLRDYEHECKAVLRKIFQRTHPDRRDHRLTEHQRQALDAAFQQALAIRKEEWRLDRRSLPRLQAILAEVEDILRFAGLEIDPRQMIQGDTLEDQLAWLEREIARLETDIAQVRNEQRLLAEDPQVLEDAASLTSEERIAEVLAELRAQQQSVERELERTQRELDRLMQMSAAGSALPPRTEMDHD